MFAQRMADTSLFEHASMYTSRDSLEGEDNGEIARLEKTTEGYYLGKNDLEIGLAGQARDDGHTRDPCF